MLEEVSAQARTTVVYIEPDHTNALLMQFLLDSTSTYALHHANDGASGLDLCWRVKPDLVITEMHLSDATAYEILRSMRNDIALESVPCIVLSGDVLPAHIERALASGFNGYWTKPIDIWQLMQSIDDAVVNPYSNLPRKANASRTSSSGIQAHRLSNPPGTTLQHYWTPAQL